MPNADTNRLMDMARIRLPGAVDAAILVELFSVLKEFFTETNAWREDLKFLAQPTQNTVHTHPRDFEYIIIPSKGAITRLLGVKDESGRPIAASMPEPGYVRLSSAPMNPENYIATVTLTVTDPTTREDYPVFPDWIMNKYQKDILDGVLGHMMSQIAKPYTSPQMAGLHMRRFRQAMARAKVEARRGNVYAAQNWRFPGNFGN